MMGEVIVLSGYGCCGKTTLANKFKEVYGDGVVIVPEMVRYYTEKTEEEACRDRFLCSQRAFLSIALAQWDLARELVKRSGLVVMDRAFIDVFCFTNMYLAYETFIARRNHLMFKAKIDKSELEHIHLVYIKPPLDDSLIKRCIDEDYSRKRVFKKYLNDINVFYNDEKRFREKVKWFMGGNVVTVDFGVTPEEILDKLGLLDKLLIKEV